MRADFSPLGGGRKEGEESAAGGGAGGLGLHSALRLLVRSVEAVASEARSHGGTAAVAAAGGGSVARTLLDRYAPRPGQDPARGGSAAPPVVLRIEQALSHSVDPLLWLHANARSGGGCGAPAVVFFADADGIREAACLGSSLTLDDLVFSRSEEEGGAAGGGGWDIVAGLPPRAELYGGSRFDQNRPEGGSGDRSRSGSGSGGRGQEWEPFGDEMWMLPAIELRREGGKATVLAVHVSFDPGTADPAADLVRSASASLEVLRGLSDRASPPAAPTDLPPVIRRDLNVGGGGEGTDALDGQEAFERGVSAALRAYEGLEPEGGCPLDDPCTELQKVVLARRADLYLGSKVSGLDLLLALRFGGHTGHLIYLRPPTGGTPWGGTGGASEFVGCTPERLFRLASSEGSARGTRLVQSESLAGTRPRGSTPDADRQLLQELITSDKDRFENVITGDFIEEVMDDMKNEGILEGEEDTPSARPGASRSSTKVFGEVARRDENMFFIRRLRQLQHICRLYERRLAPNALTSDATCRLLQNLHPTPAVNGYPSDAALKFISQYESISFDRGYYAGPFGYVGRDGADISVAIRSALLSEAPDDVNEEGINPAMKAATRVSIYAGAGIVPGSTVESEWAETSQKLGVISSLFPSSPITLQDSPTPNVAWASAFVEELVRCGITQYYVCPGSRSTPLTAALAKAIRARLGTVNALSVHDERGAAFRALGYARRTGRPAAVITSSGTAVANLYPAVVEAGMDGVPLLLLTADRPYEARDTGANQAIDQAKIFSSTYTRWFRDILPPSDDVAISSVLSDANHAVSVARNQMGPVHLNIQFRENLAPDTGAIRSDDRVGSITKFNSGRFTDTPAFRRWSVGGRQWSHSYYSTKNLGPASSDIAAVADIAELMRVSKRGIIIVGNIRNNEIGEKERASEIEHTIADFARVTGYPVFAGIQAGNLRNVCSAVVPYSEHLLKHSAVAEGIKADFILQIGSPLLSTELGKVINACVALGGSHVLLHPHYPAERSDPSYTVSHRISSDAGPYLKSLQARIEELDQGYDAIKSDVFPIVGLGKILGEEMPGIIHQASTKVTKSDSVLTEPQIILAISEVMQDSSTTSDSALFLSNSMPVRDAEFFLYPTSSRTGGPTSVAVNRGASGIDGIISAASGYADASDDPTTLVIGDLASLHDLNAFHTLARSPVPSQKSQTISSSSHSPPLTTVIVNNDGGGIFSFLPIAKHGNDVGFEEFFGTPTSTFSFEKGAEAFGLPFETASSFADFKKSYKRSISTRAPGIVEAKVAGREANVLVHAEITSLVKKTIDDFIQVQEIDPTPAELPAKVYTRNELGAPSRQKTLVLLHGWMGDKSEWEGVASSLVESLPYDWDIISIDLPGHGDSPRVLSGLQQEVRSLLGIATDQETLMNDYSIDGMAKAVLESLKRDYKIDSLDGIIGYSLGGRVGLAMRRVARKDSTLSLITAPTKLVLLGANPGIDEEDAFDRIGKDDALSFRMGANWSAQNWSDFLMKWYGAPLWGGLRERKYDLYADMVSKRSASLAARGLDHALVLKACTPPRNQSSDWKGISSTKTLFIAGELDTKYAEIGSKWESLMPGLSSIRIPNVGHALLTEAPSEVAAAIGSFITSYQPEVEIEEDARVLPQTEDVYVGHEESKVSSSSPAREVWSPSPLPAIPIGLSNLDFEAFSIELQGSGGQTKGAFGIGWGEKAQASNRLGERHGFIISLVSDKDGHAGVGEVSPLEGLHPESFAEARTLLGRIKDRLISMDPGTIPIADAEGVLALDGYLSDYVNALFAELGLPLLASVRSGMEMALLSLASQACKMPLPQALASYNPGSRDGPAAIPGKLLPLNGLVTREEGGASSASSPGRVAFPSTKVKVGHRSAEEDARAVLASISAASSFRIDGDSGTGMREGGVRADANRAWDRAGALAFAAALELLGPAAIDRVEFVEEPLRACPTFVGQVRALEELYRETSLPYALDESLADLATECGNDFEEMARTVRSAFLSGERAYGCAALVLKPSLLGLDLTMRLARLARSELGIGAVVSSAFDSGTGLAYAAFLAALADGLPSATALTRYPHGLGTFTSLGRGEEDTLSPPFGSYVRPDGTLQVIPLGRALYGLGLDEMRDALPREASGPTAAREEEEEEEDGRPDGPPSPPSQSLSSPGSSYQAQTSTSTTGGDLSIQVTLPLPFSASVACARFSDLPQQSRWSPWLGSVAYLDPSSSSSSSPPPGGSGRGSTGGSGSGSAETEWTLNVRGVRYRWRAVSEVLDDPYPGIAWESVSGLANRGLVEFLPSGAEEASREEVPQELLPQEEEDDEEDSSSLGCLMRVRMTVRTPQVLAKVFRGASSVVEEFVQNKLLKWSLESFRDVVKADLALERGDVELGDAYMGAVEGRSNAIEATLSFPMGKGGGGGNPGLKQ